MQIVVADGFEFRFTNALDAFVFDEKDSSKPTFHGAPMKAVDIVAEFNDCYYYIELKDYTKQSTTDDADAVIDKQESHQKHTNWLKNYLKYKFRDSYLYRHAENKVDKPIHYLCLIITFDNALNTSIQSPLKRELPVGRASKRWGQALASSCHVLNLDNWKKNFPQWPVKRL